MSHSRLTTVTHELHTDLESEATTIRCSPEGSVDGLQQHQVLLVQQVHFLRVKPLRTEGIGGRKGNRAHTRHQILLAQHLDGCGYALCLLSLQSSKFRYCASTRLYTSATSCLAVTLRMLTKSLTTVRRTSKKNDPGVM